VEHNNKKVCLHLVTGNKILTTHFSFWKIRALSSQFFLRAAIAAPPLDEPKERALDAAAFNKASALLVAPEAEAEVLFLGALVVVVVVVVTVFFFTVFVIFLLAGFLWEALATCFVAFPLGTLVLPPPFFGMAHTIVLPFFLEYGKFT